MAICLLAGVNGCHGGVSSEYVLAEQPLRKWILIEYLVPSCPPLKSTSLGIEISIPASGVGCTSSPLSRGPMIPSYYISHADGTRSELRLGRDIQVPQVIDGPFRLIGENGVIKKECHITAEAFWYGPGSVVGSPVEVIKAHHPECP